LLRAAGVTPRALAFERAERDKLVGADFDQYRTVDGYEGLDVNAHDVPFARLAQAGISALSDSSFQASKRLLWLHAPEPGIPPEGFANLYFEDFEERGLSLVDVPREEWPRLPAVAAGSVSLVDHWMGVLLQEIDAKSDNRPTLIVISAASGRAWMDDYLEESRATGRDKPSETLRDQQVRSPLIIATRHEPRFAGLSSIRSSQFVQPADLLPTLLDWFGGPSTDSGSGRSLFQIPLSDAAPRDAVIFGDEDKSFGIRTKDWTYLTRMSDQNDADDSSCRQLFLKPEDTWDVTDVSTQYPEVCDELQAKLEMIRKGSVAN
jgi:arylsulfatase A-like enzyme